MKKRNLNIVIIFFMGALMAITKAILDKKIKEKDDLLKKIHELYMAFDRWIQIRQKGKSLSEYFQQNNYKTIAIYGMKELGKRLYDELCETDVTVLYIIDKNADAIYADVNVVTPDENLSAVDVIVVTAIYYFDEIEEMLKNRIDCPVISLEDILYEL